MVVSKVAAHHDVTHLCPTVQSAIEGLIVDPKVTPSTLKAAYTALLQLERCRRATGARSAGSEQDILQIDHRNSGKICVATADGAVSLSDVVGTTLAEAG